nr:MAG TPA: hypothetical protein [Caudoviricetes sp.]
MQKNRRCLIPSETLLIIFYQHSIYINSFLILLY